VTLRFLDLFAGIGGMRRGLENTGMECVGYVERDKFARLSYEALFQTKGEWSVNDIQTVEPGSMPKAEGRHLDARIRRLTPENAVGSWGEPMQNLIVPKRPEFPIHNFTSKRATRSFLRLSPPSVDALPNRP